MLLGAAEEIGRARAYAGFAQGRIADALGLLSGLDANHHESLVPPTLHKAADELARGIGLIGAGETSVADIAARL